MTTQLPFEIDVSSKYGAPMGRGGDKPSYDAETLTVRNVVIDSQGYDAGGAYWGIGQTLFAFMDSDDRIEYSRHPSKRAALDYAREEYAPETVITFEGTSWTLYWHSAHCADCGEGVTFPSEWKDSGSCDCGAYIEGDSIWETETEQCEFEG